MKSMFYEPSTRSSLYRPTTGRGFATPSFTGATVQPACSPAVGQPETRVRRHWNTGSRRAPSARPRRYLRAASRAAGPAKTLRSLVSVLACLVMAVYSSEAALFAPQPRSSDECGCAPGCVCRSDGGQCTCRKGTLNLGAACGCGAQTPTADAPPSPFAGLPAAGPVVVQPDVRVTLRPGEREIPDPGLARTPPHPP